MKVRLKVDVSGSRNGVDWPRRGSVVDLPDGEAADMCAAGMADPVVEDRVETAVAPEPETRNPDAPEPLTTRRGPAKGTRKPAED